MVAPDFSTLTNDLIRQYLGGILVAISTGIGMTIIKFIRCIKKLNRRSWRTTQAVLLMSELIDDETAELHPTHKGHEIADKIKTLLKDEDGRL